jgi:3-methylcrotonyl-CoA carboxylase alpha subunit
VPAPRDPDVVAVAALEAAGLLEAREPFTGFALWAPMTRDVALGQGEERLRVAVTTEAPGQFRIDGRAVKVTGRDGMVLDCTIDGADRRFALARAGTMLTVFDRAEATVFDMPDPLEGVEAAHAGGDDIRAPMPGLVKHLAARPVPWWRAATCSPCSRR